MGTAQRTRTHGRHGPKKEDRRPLGWLDRRGMESGSFADEFRRAALVTQAEWARSAAQLAAACTVLGGSHVHPWRRLTSGLITPPAAWPELREQLLTNLLCYRANYAQIVVAWSLVCVVRHPLRAVWLVLLAAGLFHVLLVRRSVLNIPLGKDGRVFTLMHRQLQGTVAVVSLVWLFLTGTAWLLLTLTVLPALLILGHASVCPPTSNRSALVREVQQGLAAAFRHKDADTEEMEGGIVAVPPPRDAELAKRVEQIRQKYRRVTRPLPRAPITAKAALRLRLDLRVAALPYCRPLSPVPGPARAPHAS